MDRLVVSDLRSALEEEGVEMDVVTSKMNPLKTNKQRNTSNNHRKSQQRSGVVGGNSTDDDDRVSQKTDHNHSMLSLPLSGVTADEEGFCKCEGDNENETTTNNEDQSGLVDSENDNITARLCCLSKLSIHGGGGTNMADDGEGTSQRCTTSTAGGCGSTYAPSRDKEGSHPISISKTRNTSYPSFPESDSFTEIQHLHQNPVQSSSGCVAGGATTGDGASGGQAGVDNASRRYRRRRRRRGHNPNSKRMAVDASPADKDSREETSTGYSIIPAECPGPSGGAHSSKRYNKLDKNKLVNVVDSFGMKRKRNVTAGIAGSSGSGGKNNSKLNVVVGNMDMCDMEDLSLNSPEIMADDQEMKSDEDEDEYSSFDSVDEEGDEDDRGREADDEQSDWVFDEWGTNSKKSSQEECALSRKKRLLKMLRSYNNMIISSNPGCSTGANLLDSNAQLLQSREIRAGKRRVFLSKPFPSTGIWTSANEEVSKFLQDPLQSQIRLQPISVEERVQLSHLASLYSLRMNYCSNPDEAENAEEMPQEEEVPKLFPVLTKTPNTTQMDKIADPSASSLFNAEGSSSSNVSSVYCPTYSDVDSKTSDSKRIKK